MFSARVKMVMNEKLDDDESENVGVKDVIQPPWIDRIHYCWEDELTVDAV